MGQRTVAVNAIYDVMRVFGERITGYQSIFTLTPRLYLNSVEYGITLTSGETHRYFSVLVDKEYACADPLDGCVALTEKVNEWLKNGEQGTPYLDVRNPVLFDPRKITSIVNNCVTEFIPVVEKKPEVANIRKRSSLLHRTSLPKRTELRRYR